jgi:hypothetical protein
MVFATYWRQVAKRGHAFEAGRATGWAFLDSDKRAAQTEGSCAVAWPQQAIEACAPEGAPGLDWHFAAARPSTRAGLHGDQSTVIKAR